MKDIIDVKVILINSVVVLKSVKLRLGLRLSFVPPQLRCDGTSLSLSPSLSLTDFGQAAPSDLLAALTFLSLS